MYKRPRHVNTSELSTLNSFAFCSISMAVVVLPSLINILESIKNDCSFFDKEIASLKYCFAYLRRIINEFRL